MGHLKVTSDKLMCVYEPSHHPSSTALCVGVRVCVGGLGGECEGLKGDKKFIAT